MQRRKKPQRNPLGLFAHQLETVLRSHDISIKFKILAVTYSCMPEGHTTIGAQRFHFRVRYGIGWFPLAIAARQTGSRAADFAISRA